jgi:hypothetical protein
MRHNPLFLGIWAQAELKCYHLPRIISSCRYVHINMHLQHLIKYTKTHQLGWLTDHMYSGCLGVSSMCKLLSEMFYICTVDVTNIKRRIFWVFLFILYVIQHCFICRPQIPLCRRMLGPKPGLLRLCHWQSDALKHSAMCHPINIYNTYIFTFFIIDLKVVGNEKVGGSRRWHIIDIVLRLWW